MGIEILFYSFFFFFVNMALLAVIVTVIIIVTVVHFATGQQRCRLDQAGNLLVQSIFLSHVGFQGFHRGIELLQLIQHGVAAHDTVTTAVVVVVIIIILDVVVIVILVLAAGIIRLQQEVQGQIQGRRRLRQGRRQEISLTLGSGTDHLGLIDGTSFFVVVVVVQGPNDTVGPFPILPHHVPESSREGQKFRTLLIQIASLVPPGPRAVLLWLLLWRFGGWFLWIVVVVRLLEKILLVHGRVPRRLHLLGRLLFDAGIVLVLTNFQIGRVAVIIGRCSMAPIVKVVVVVVRFRVIILIVAIVVVAIIIHGRFLLSCFNIVFIVVRILLVFATAAATGTLATAEIQHGLALVDFVVAAVTIVIVVLVTQHLEIILVHVQRSRSITPRLVVFRFHHPCRMFLGRLVARLGRIATAFLTAHCWL
mmetsp:Transcript_8377/g.18023  ORF Transcript_8377/g.18023 Transcript_8377/m.18023 type:complete len:421 (-) Transcript_8377:105-1367(-)